MKTEQKLEVYRELFGSLPEAPAGKELVGIEYRSPKTNEVHHLHGMWLENVCMNYSEGEKRMVATFLNTHREDGTPISIDPLPEVEGCRVEYFGQYLSPEDMGDASGYTYLCVGWQINMDDTMPMEEESLHYALIYKIAQPTTLADLVGEDGQKIVWIMVDDSQKCQSLILSGDDNSFDLFFAEESHSIEELARSGIRWSNSPFTTWADAKEFTPE